MCTKEPPKDDRTRFNASYGTVTSQLTFNTTSFSRKNIIKIPRNINSDIGVTRAMYLIKENER